MLGAEGFGQLSDVLAGIDWVIYHAKEYNIRVMNLSLAADSTETYLTDPLARAARAGGRRNHRRCRRRQFRAGDRCREAFGASARPATTRT